MQAKVVQMLQNVEDTFWKLNVGIHIQEVLGKVYLAFRTLQLGELGNSVKLTWIQILILHPVGYMKLLTYRASFSE